MAIPVLRIPTRVILVHTKSMVAASGSQIILFDLPPLAIPMMFRVIIETPFNGTNPTLSIGTPIEASKYVPTSGINLKGAAGTIYEYEPSEPANGVAIALVATYAAAGSATGAARIETYYGVPG